MTFIVNVPEPVYILTYRVITGFLHSVTYRTSCFSAVLSKQQITDTPKYDRYYDLSILIRIDELDSSLNTLWIRCYCLSRVNMANQCGL